MAYTVYMGCSRMIVLLLYDLASCVEVASLGVFDLTGCLGGIITIYS
jgi:hypothetical protein